MGVCTTDGKRNRNQKQPEPGFDSDENKNGSKKEEPIVKPPGIIEPINQNDNPNPNIDDGNNKEIPVQKNVYISNNLISRIVVTEKPIGGNKNDDQINYGILDSINKKSQDQETDNNSYEQLDIQKNYYLICPTCELYILNVESVEYNSDSNDFKFKYKCFCNEVKENYFESIKREKKPICNNHNSEIEFICQDCMTKICKECKNKDHDLHNIKNIISHEVIPESIKNIISKKKECFKGFNIFEKIFNFYKNYPMLTNLPDNTEEKKSQESENNDKNNIIQKNEKKQEEETNISNQNGELNIPKNSIKPDKNDEIENNIDDNLNNSQNANNINNNLNNSGNENNPINNKNNMDIKNIITITNNDDSGVNGTKPEIKTPNDTNNFINNQSEERFENEINNTNIENINAISQNNKEINPFERESNSGKPEENIFFNYNFNKREINNNNTIDNINNNINSDIQNNNNDNIDDDDFQIIYNNSKDSANKNLNEEKNIIVGENINKVENNNNLNNINYQNGLKGENDNNLNNNNNITDSINVNNSLLIKQYSNTKTLIGHKDLIVSLIKLSTGYIATGSYDMSIKIWDIKKDQKEALVTTKYSVGYILCLLELKRNELLAGNSENCIDIFNLADKKSTEPDYRLFGHSLWVTALVKCDEDHFASASNDTKIFIWDSNKKNKLKELLGHSDCILTMILLENGNLCSGSADKTIRIWDWKNANCLSYLKAHNNWVKSICQFNSQILLSGSDDRKIRIWNLNLNLLEELEGHKHSVRAFCKIDDNYFASGGFDNTIKIWDFNKKVCVDSLEGHISNIICIIKYDGKLISCSNDRTIKIWEKK